MKLRGSINSNKGIFKNLRKHRINTIAEFGEWDLWGWGQGADWHRKVHPHAARSRPDAREARFIGEFTLLFI